MTDGVAVSIWDVLGQSSNEVLEHKARGPLGSIPYPIAARNVSILEQTGLFLGW
jgi:hypothetical protein